ncbi:MAG: polysaccharide biosynthesis protein [Vicinamibacterales bacterium]
MPDPSPDQTGNGCTRKRLLDAVLRYRRLYVVLVHFLLILLANQLAFQLRFDFAVPASMAEVSLRYLPLLFLIRAGTFVPFRLYQGLWRYTSVSDLRDIIAGVSASSAVFYLLVRWGMGVTAYPRSVYIIDAILLISSMGGVRLLRRVYRELGRIDCGRRLLIYGAGDAGEMIARDIRHRDYYRYDPVGFVDDDRAKVGRRIHGLPVLGTREDLPAILQREKPDEILVAIPSAEPAAVRSIVRALEPFKVPIKTLPNLRDVLDGRVSVSQIRSLKIEDLLPRAPVGLDPEPVRSLVEGEVVMVTGAGGSIGSELCRQLLAFKPKRLLLFERHENSLFAISNELLAAGGGDAVVPLIGDVTDWNRVSEVIGHHRPALIFHAAAHKHVPLMEMNPCEAVKNNVGGTWVLARVAARAGVKRFVLISTDKAVNPTSVMGATKRVCETIVQALQDGNGSQGTCFTAVRFGNVLGSSGSVVPTFQAQIAAGGPVTVTHPEVKRYFMLIPEAVQLVLHAAALAEGGEVFVLDMGEQIKLLDLARTMIRLSGYVPDEEISISFTGLRPGEKLSEDLVGVAESAERLSVEKILRVRRNGVPEAAAVARTVERLQQAALANQPTAVVERLKESPPSFAHATVTAPDRHIAFSSSPPPGEASDSPSALRPPASHSATCPHCGSRQQANASVSPRFL